MKILKKDYRSAQEIVTDVSDEIVKIYFCPREKNSIFFEIKRKDVPALINLLKRSFDGEKIQSFKSCKFNDN